MKAKSSGQESKSSVSGAAPSGRAARGKEKSPNPKRAAKDLKREAISPEITEQLWEAARQAQAAAHAPYSHFPVGASLLTDLGEIYAGCNVENASYPLTVCAERNAIGCWVASGKKGRVIACLVVGPVDVPLTPCGACRQVLAEFNAEMTVICCGQNGARAVHRLADLLPHRFSL